MTKTTTENMSTTKTTTEMKLPGTTRQDGPEQLTLRREKKCLKSFLNARKADKGCEFTHTSLSGGSYYIAGDDYDDFLDLYKDAFKAGYALHLTEKHSRECPILIDLDFRQTTMTRQYTHEHVTKLISTLLTVIKEYLVCPSEFKIYVLEKPSPRKYKNQIKDGVHIMIPDIVTAPNFQYFLRQQTKDVIYNHLSDCGFTNTADDIYDKAVIEKNNWFMYGSKKPDEPHAWTVTSIFQYDTEYSKMCIVDCDNNIDQLVDILSIRNKFHITPECQEFSFIPDSAPVCPSKHADVIKHISTISTDIELVCKLVDLLNIARADTYNDWISIGWCLHNISPCQQLLEKWIDFSMNSEKYEEGICERLWGTMRSHGLTMGSLCMWVKEDNPEQYTSLMNSVFADKQISSLLYKCRNETHAAVARLTHYMFKDRFVYVNLEKSATWYEFRTHRWRECPQGLSLRLLIGTQVCARLSKYVCELNTMAAEFEDETQREPYLKAAETIGKLAVVKLGTTNFRDNVLKECRELFQVDKIFIEELDSKNHLIGFNNGIYDLNVSEFRDGKPEDMVSMTVGYDYIGKEDPDIRAKLIAFFDNFMPNEDMRDYILNVYAYCLNGDKYLQEISFFTGTGANAKGVHSDLIKVTFGEYRDDPDVTMITTKKQSSSAANGEVAKCKGRRLLVMSEPSEDDKFQVGLIKQFSGGDTIQARALYKDPIEFKPQFHMVVLANNMPQCNGFDGGIARRVKIVQFPFKFIDNPILPFHRQSDDNLRSYLVDTLEVRQQMMLILIDYYNKNVKGRKRFYTPPEVDKHTKDYCNDNDIIGSFIKDMYEITYNDEDIIRADYIYEAFKASDYYNQKDKVWFGKQMKANNFVSVKCTKGEHRLKYIYKGLKAIESEYHLQDVEDSLDA
jgi:P4 family phage/plasmid primase-like protien